MSKHKPILLSGIQPSGDLNIGHYIGAIKNWSLLQEKYECLFSLVDLHAITTKQDPKQLRERCYNLLALYIACGIDPKKNTLFIQSHVPQHTQLAWVLNCFTYMGELNRMTQFKDKSKQHEANINVGLFDYPVLMAADILIYNANLVPVGDDQKQHLELTRDIAIRFNNTYGEIFTVPEPFIPPPNAGGRIMSLLDPSKKMSKSDPDQNNVIGLLDKPDVLVKKIKRAVTDSGAEVRYDLNEKPGVANLLTIYAAITEKEVAELEQQYAGKGYGAFKSELAEAVVEFLKPIQQRYDELRADHSALEKILRHGAEAAKVRADKVLLQVYDAVGFIKS